MRKGLFKWWIDGNYWECIEEHDACFAVFKDSCDVVDLDDPEIWAAWEEYLEAETLSIAADKRLASLVGRA